MTDTVITALISAGSSGLVAVTALLLNYRGFASIDGRLASIENRVGALEGRVESRFSSLETRVDKRLDRIEQDQKEFFRVLGEQDKRISKLEG